MPASATALSEPFTALGEHITVGLPAARAVFTTRRGGLSGPPYDSLNLGILTEDDPDLVRANRQRLSDELGVPLAWGRQVHGSEVRIVDAPTGQEVRDGDGLVTATPGLGLLVLAADCLPIAIAGGGAVAIVHAGWPGLAAGVIESGVRALRELGSGGPMAAAIGPGARACCYEVGDELRERFAEYGSEAMPGRNLDLALIARRQLESAGVGEVHDVGLCTISSEPSLFFSHRRDRGMTGRQAGVAWLT
jgi:YfiH family protein